MELPICKLASRLPGNPRDMEGILSVIRIKARLALPMHQLRGTAWEQPLKNKRPTLLIMRQGKVAMLGKRHRTF